MGLYLYASGAQKQIIAVLSRFGITESYTSITQNSAPTSEPPVQVASEQPVEPTSLPSQSSSAANASSPSPPSNKTIKPEAKRARIGTLQKLSASVRTKARGIAAVGLFGEVYDNINFMSRTGEQAVAHHGMSKSFIRTISSNSEFE